MKFAEMPTKCRQVKNVGRRHPHTPPLRDVSGCTLSLLLKYAWAALFVQKGARGTHSALIVTIKVYFQAATTQLLRTRKKSLHFSTSSIATTALNKRWQLKQLWITNQRFILISLVTPAILHGRCHSWRRRQNSIFIATKTGVFSSLFLPPFSSAISECTCLEKPCKRAFLRPPPVMGHSTPSSAFRFLFFCFSFIIFFSTLTSEATYQVLVEHIPRSFCYHRRRRRHGTGVNFLWLITVFEEQIYFFWVPTGCRVRRSAPLPLSIRLEYLKDFATPLSLLTTFRLRSNRFSFKCK